jgi:hypothetical protein
MDPFPIPPNFPNAANTGVPAGVTLKPAGPLTISTPGAVVSGLDVSGPVYISAPNVTLENSRITAAGYSVVKIEPGVTGVVIRNNEINGTGTHNDGSNGITGAGTFVGNNIYNVENGIALNDSHALIEGNYIHDLQASGSPHYDGVQIDGNIADVAIRGNSIVVDHDQTSAVMVDNYFGPISNVKIEGNFLAGAGYTVYSDGKFNGGPISGVSFLDNTMLKGQWGYVLARDNVPAWSGNVDAAAGRVIGLNGTLGAPAKPAPPRLKGSDAGDAVKPNTFAGQLAVNVHADGGRAHLVAGTLDRRAEPPPVSAILADQPLSMLDLLF